MPELRAIINARMECSAKVLKELGLARKPVGYGSFAVDPFFSWYAHLFYMDRKKCLLFVNCLTRYPVIALYLSRCEIEYLNAILSESIKPQLVTEGVSDGVISRFLEHLYRPEITRSKNRPVIGTAVADERLIFAHLENPYTEHKARTQTELSLRLARYPILAMKEEPFPYKAFSNELFARYGETGHFRFDPIAMRPSPLH